MRVLTLVVLLGASLVGRGLAEKVEDSRALWAYEGGWFAKDKDGSWHEYNEVTLRKLGKPSKFKEVRRTKEHVELLDEGRKIAIRLSESWAESRPSDREEATWEKLYYGRWKTPVPAE